MYKPTYRWVIERDYLVEAEEDYDGEGSVGIQGPRGCDRNLETNPKRFVMKDDDNTVYYSGTIYGEYDGTEPLDDFGTPNAGCTSIWYNGERL